MKILLINKFHYHKGGSETVYFDTKAVLEAHGHQVVCFSMQDGKNEPCAQSEYFVPKVDFRSGRLGLGKMLRLIYDPRAARNLEKLIQAEKPDLAHLHNIAHQLTPSILKPLRKHKIPTVQTLHDFQIICPNYTLYVEGRVCERCKKHKYCQAIFHRCLHGHWLGSFIVALELTFQWWFKYYKENVDLFISPSQFLKNKLMEWGIKRPIVVINNFVDLDKLSPGEEMGDYIVCVSRLSPEKGVMTLIRAMEKASNVKLKIVGDGPQQKTLQSYLRQRKIKNVEMLGRKDRAETLAVIRGARFMVIPSVCYDNYPTVALEAMALARPILASRLGGLAEMITENHNGWFFQPGNEKDLAKKIQEHFGETESLIALGRNGRRAVEQKNSSAVYYKNLWQAYEQVLPDKEKMEAG